MNRDNENQRDRDWWYKAATMGGIVAGATAVAGTLYYLSGKKEEEPQAEASSHRGARRSSSSPRTRDAPDSSQAQAQGSSGSGMSDYLSRFMQGLSTGATGSGSGSTAGNGGGFIGESRRGVPRSSVPRNPQINNMNALLSDIYLRYISLNDEDFELYYSVMHNIFRQLHYKMKEVDPYYAKYSSTVQYAGSHPDRLRINKPDEFDIDIVISLPLCYDPGSSDIVLEPKDPGFLQLKMGVQFEKLPYRDGSEWEINKAAYKWMEQKTCYLLRSNFSDWFKGVVDRALNHFQASMLSPPTFYVEGVPYTVRKSESGPAKTLFIENASRNFKLDVDLVPAIRFPIERWPVCTGYRSVSQEIASVKNYWMVVPKPNKAGQTKHDELRSWRVALHEQEAMLMHDTNNLRHAIRLLKKFRDAQSMDKIASYYIKTLLFWEVVERNDRAFWNNNPAYLFQIMVKKFHRALVEGKIPYFWNKNNNLIGGVSRTLLNTYAAKTQKLIDVLEQPSEYRQAAKLLLTDSEFAEYRQILGI